MRLLVSLALAGIILVSATSAAVAGSHTSGVSIRASVGFGNLYRSGPQWVPVRVRVSNAGSALLTGTVTVRGNTGASATYSQRVLLYPGTTKDATIYVPAPGVGNSVSVSYLSNGRLRAQALAYPEAIGDQDLLVGGVTDDPAAAAWLRQASPSGTHLHISALSPASLPSVPEALAAFDALVLTNVDTSRLDSAQIAAIQDYVRGGGTLLLVGGPDWQATLGGLPPALVPGTPMGLRSLPRLPVPRFLETASAPRGTVGIAPLRDVRGAVLLSGGGTPLVLKSPDGNGLIEYLAFDPSAPPFTAWKGRQAFVTALLTDAMPLSMRRLSLDIADRSTSFLFPGSQPMALGAELANVPSPALPLLLGLLVLVVGALVFVFAATVMVRRLRPRLAPLAVPLAMLLSLGSLVQAVPAFARSRTIVNSLAFVRLDGQGPTYSASVYAGLIASAAGSYRLDYAYPSLASNLSGLYPGPYWDAGTAVSEDATSSVDLGRVGLWSARAVALRTVVSLQGRVTAELRLARSGAIIGRIRNDTDVALRKPALIAGRSYRRLADIPPHSSVGVSLSPSADPQDHDYLPMLTRIYGRPQTVGNGIPAVTPFGNPSDMPEEKNIDDRIRDAVDTLPETNLVSMLGEITLVAWSDAPLIPISVNGSTVQTRELSLLVKPVPSLTVTAKRIHLRTGTVGAQVLRVVPAPSVYECCGSTAQPISLGPGGSAMFGLSLPGRSMSLSSLRIHIYAGGQDPTTTGYEDVPRHAASAYDWRKNAWKTLRFRRGVAAPSHPDRLVSSNGTILVRLVARRSDLSILDPHQDLQIEGTESQR